MLRDRCSPCVRSILACAVLALALSGAAPPARAGAVLESLRVHPTPASVPPGGAFAFGVIGTYSDGSRRDLTRKARFSAGDAGVASLAGKNVFVGGRLGVTEIRASVGGLVSSENALLRVSPIASLAIAPDEAGVRLGSRVLFGAEATLADGTEDVEATHLVDWSSLAPAVLSIGNGRKDKALARGLALGAAEVVATDPRSGVVARKPIAVVDALLGIEVTPASRVLQLDDSRRYRALGSFAAAGGGVVLADVTLDVKWSSSRKDVATIDKYGRPRPRRIGETALAAVDRRTGIASTDTGGDGELIVVGEVLSLTVTPASAALAVGDALRLDALALFAGNSAPFSWGRRVGWASSAPAVAEVDGDGDVLCLAAGSATVRARDPKTGRTSTATGGDALITCEPVPTAP